MSPNDYLALSIQVLKDWRVLAVAALTLVVWAVLRYVGMVYRRRPTSLRAAPKQGRASAPRPARRPAPPPSSEDQGDFVE